MRGILICLSRLDFVPLKLHLGLTLKVVFMKVCQVRGQKELSLRRLYYMACSGVQWLSCLFHCPDQLMRYHLQVWIVQQKEKLLDMHSTTASSCLSMLILQNFTVVKVRPLTYISPQFPAQREKKTKSERSSAILHGYYTSQSIHFLL